MKCPKCDTDQICKYCNGPMARISAPIWAKFECHPCGSRVSDCPTCAANDAFVEKVKEAVLFLNNVCPKLHKILNPDLTDVWDMKGDLTLKLKPNKITALREEVEKDG